jgi:hypothetical protein
MKNLIVLENWDDLIEAAPHITGTIEIGPHFVQLRNDPTYQFCEHTLSVAKTAVEKFTKLPASYRPGLVETMLSSGV